MDNAEEVAGNGENEKARQISRQFENKPDTKNDSNLSGPKSLEGNDMESCGDFEMITAEGIPKHDSEEIKCMHNAPSTSHMLGLILSGFQQTPCIVSSYLPDFALWTNATSLFQGLTTDTALTNAENSDAIIQLSNDLKGDIEEGLKEAKTFEDEIRWRECLVQALLDKCTEVIKQNLTGNDTAMTLIYKQNCISNEEHLYLKGNPEDPAQYMRRFFSMILDRDLKTIFTFVCILKLHSRQLFEKISSAFHKNMLEKKTIPMKCSHCTLIERVNIRTVVNNLAKWRKIFQKVSEAKLHESEGLWKEFMESIKSIDSTQMYEEAASCLLKGIEACGFHTDILRMLRVDVELKINIFICRCKDVCNTTEAYFAHYGKTDGHSNGPAVTDSFVVSNCVESEHSVCLEPAQREECNQTSSAKNKENENGFVHSQPSSLKRKKSLMEESHNIDRPKKKVSDCLPVSRQSDRFDKSSGDTKPDTNDESISKVTLQEQENRKNNKTIKGDNLSDNLKIENLKVHVAGYDSEQDSFLSETETMPSETDKDMKGKNFIAVNSDKNHRLDNLKIGVEGYDSEQDSGFSQTQSLPKEGDSGVYNKSVDENETIPKQIMSVPDVSDSNNCSCENQDTQESERCQSSITLKCIDADSDEQNDKNLNREALEDALGEIMDDDDGIGKQDEDMHETDSDSQTFINLVIKK